MFFAIISLLLMFCVTFILESLYAGFFSIFLKPETRAARKEKSPKPSLKTGLLQTEIGWVTLLALASLYILPGIFYLIAWQQPLRLPHLFLLIFLPYIITPFFIAFSLWLFKPKAAVCSNEHLYLSLANFLGIIFVVSPAMTNAIESGLIRFAQDENQLGQLEQIADMAFDSESDPKQLSENLHEKLKIVFQRPVDAGRIQIRRDETGIRQIRIFLGVHYTLLLTNDSETATSPPGQKISDRIYLVTGFGF
ncbi:MAG: hypothetical protein JJU29_15165 [Verrucomicrobia bacterium]|nr:hypothetical protein [Verrucomicrobiota bacterium]MCH8512443.1 hypothetical protein [Kiritimatiellia bacterium]